MPENLLKQSWSELDLHDLRLLLDQRIGGPGQYDGEPLDPNSLYLPLGRQDCQVKLTFRRGRLVSIEAGPAFNAEKWQSFGEEVERSLLRGPIVFGRNLSFSSLRVEGHWRGNRSKVQILPPPESAPRAPVEMAEHPIILEFPLQKTETWRISNDRRLREHRKLTRLLNVLLAGWISCPIGQPKHFWAAVPPDAHPDKVTCAWVQEFYFARFGEVIAEELSAPTGQPLEIIPTENYFTEVGQDGRGLRIPADLDDLLCAYKALSPERRARFDRAAYWFDLASRQWTFSMSASFASLVSAVEALTERGATHRIHCEQCGKDVPHDAPGATERFRTFFETHARYSSMKSRNEMYALRSGILHGGELMQFDDGTAFGWDPPGWNERQLHDDLWSLTRDAMRNWLNSVRSSENGEACE